MDSILIIDDEPQIRKLLSRMMELEGYEVFQAADCQSTLKQLKLHNPQVVLCDVFLPDGNGVDMVTTIKKLYPELEVILLTAHGNIPDGVQAIKNGAFDYITKGDDNNKIIPLISRAMAQAKKNVGEKVKTEETQSFSFATSRSIGPKGFGNGCYSLADRRNRHGERGLCTSHPSQQSSQRECFCGCKLFCF